jgi:hypothetical protein
MSLEKAIEHHKEFREPYRKSKRFDKTCRNHGSCPWCEGNRTFCSRKRLFKIQEELKETKQYE